MVYIVEAVVLTGYFVYSSWQILSQIQYTRFLLHVLLYCCSIYMADGLWVDGFVGVVGTCGICMARFTT